MNHTVALQPRTELACPRTCSLGLLVTGLPSLVLALAVHAYRDLVPMPDVV